VAALTAELGAAVIDADTVTRELTTNDPQLRRAIIAEFGSEVSGDTGELDRRMLGQRVFSDPEALRRLEELLHPLVRLEISRRIHEQANNCGAFVALEAIKLMQSPLALECEVIWVVECAPEVQLERLVKNRHMKPAEAEDRIAATPRFVADVPIVRLENNGSMDELRQAVGFAWKAFSAMVPTASDIPPKT
jgi:dephospho-CoA kinase